MSDPKDTSNAPEHAPDLADDTDVNSAGVPEDREAGAAPGPTPAEAPVEARAEPSSSSEGGGAEAQIAALEAQVADLKDRLLRAVADAENTRKRAERDKQDASKYAMASFARDVLSVGDNMRRAIDAVSQADREAAAEPVRNLIAGVEMTEREFLSVLERHGVKPLNPVGEKFDPNHHQAMYEVPDDTKPAGTVVEVVAAGYVIGDRLLRPAMVGVSKGGPSGGAPGTPKDGAGDEGGGAGGGESGTTPGSTPGSTIDTKA